MTNGKTRAAITVTGLTVLAMYAISNAIAAAPTKSAGNAAAGQKVYAANNCKACHAINGVGGTGGPNLTTTGADAKHTAAWFKTQVMDPKKNNPDSTMPPYADKIKGKDLDNIAAYLVSLKKASK